VVPSCGALVRRGVVRRGADFRGVCEVWFGEEWIFRGVCEVWFGEDWIFVVWVRYGPERSGFFVVWVWIFRGVSEVWFGEEWVFSWYE
jgi:hypothetical protein